MSNTSSTYIAVDCNENTTTQDRGYTALVVAVGLGNALDRMRDIRWLMDKAQCAETVAIAYLEAEEWHCRDAWTSLDGDRAQLGKTSD